MLECRVRGAPLYLLQQNLTICQSLHLYHNLVHFAGKKYKFNLKLHLVIITTFTCTSEICHINTINSLPWLITRSALLNSGSFKPVLFLTLQYLLSTLQAVKFKWANSSNSQLDIFVMHLQAVILLFPLLDPKTFQS